MYTIICTSDNPCMLQSIYDTKEEAIKALKHLQGLEYSSVMKQTISLYGKDYYKGIPKETPTGVQNNIVFRKYEIKEVEEEIAKSLLR